MKGLITKTSKDAIRVSTAFSGLNELIKMTILIRINLTQNTPGSDNKSKEIIIIAPS